MGMPCARAKSSAVLAAAIHCASLAGAPAWAQALAQASANANAARRLFIAEQAAAPHLPDVVERRGALAEYAAVPGQAHPHAGVVAAARDRLLGAYRFQPG